MAANPRTVVVVNTGSQVEMPWLERVPAVLQLWYPGQELGHALADVLFGDRPFTGKLPFHWPHSMDQLPLGTGEQPEALFPLGFGLE